MASQSYTVRRMCSNIMLYQNGLAYLDSEKEEETGYDFRIHDDQFLQKSPIFRFSLKINIDF